MTPEGKVKAAVKAVLKKLKAYQHWPVPTGYGTPTVDCLACAYGVFFAIECKRPGVRKGTQNQQKTLAEVREAGGIALLINTADETEIGRMIWEAAERR